MTTIVKKSKEIINNKASLLSPLEKLANEHDLQKKINKKLDSKNITSESFVGRKSLETNIEKAPSKNLKESFVKRIIKTSLGILGFGIGKEVLSDKATENVAGTTAEILTDDTKLKILNDSAEEQLETLKQQNKIISKLEGDGSKNSFKQIKEKVEKYRKDDFKFMNLLKDTWESTAKNEKNEDRWLITRFFITIGRIIPNYILFQQTKNAVKNGNLAKYDEFKKTANNLKEEGKELEKSAKKGLKNSKQALRAKKESGFSFLLKKIPAKNLVKGFEKEVAFLNKSFETGEISAKKLAKGLQEANIKLFKDATLNRQVKPLLKIMGKGGIKGIELPANFSLKKANPFKNITKLKINPLAMAVSVAITKAVFDGKDKASFREVGRSLFSKETLQEAFIPGVGSIRSVKHNWNNSEIPTWLKITDIGLNVAGDIALAAGYVSAFFSFGAGAAAGVAGRTAIVGLGKRWLTREGLEIAAKEIGKTVVTKEGRKIALNSAKKSVIQGAKASAITTPIMLGAQITMKKIFSKDKVNEAFNGMLREEQRRTIEISKKVEKEYKKMAA
jgi:hypothetical protein